jgi:hypothetical protein
VNYKASCTRARGEIQAFSAACESYKADYGAYPRLTLTTEQDTGSPPPPIDPRVNGNPLGANYIAASLYLYEQLSGDLTHKLQPGTIPPGGTVAPKIYMAFKPTMLSINNPGGSSTIVPGTSVVAYIQDPFGNSYGYSTAAAKAEEDYRTAATGVTYQAPPPGTSNASTPLPPPPARDPVSYGYNPTFDMWCTSGIVRATTPVADADHERWIKNW